jgi:hypothetical protein
MLELIEIQKVASQGMTCPLLCKGSDGKAYYAKGRKATPLGLIKEWLVANLAKAFGLPIPNFDIAYIDKSLVESYGNEAIEYLGSGDVFVSEQIKSATDLNWHILNKITIELQRDVLFFDLWVENSDRTFSEKFSGNPNLIWDSSASQLYVIDHNLAFDSPFDGVLFWQTHACRTPFLVNQLDIEIKLGIEKRLQNALQGWSSWWDQIPSEWKEQNEESKFFDADATLERLQKESQGEIWAKWL